MVIAGKHLLTCTHVQIELKLIGSVKAVKYKYKFIQNLLARPENRSQDQYISSTDGVAFRLSRPVFVGTYFIRDIGPKENSPHERYQ